MSYHLIQLDKLGFWVLEIVRWPCYKQRWSLELCHDFCPYRIFCYRTNLKDLGCWLLDLTLIIRWHRILKLKDWGQRLKIKYEAVSSVQFIWVTQRTNVARFPFLYRFQLSQILYRILKKIQIPCTLIILLHFTFFFIFLQFWDMSRACQP